MGASGENMPISKENGEYKLKWEPTDKSMEFLEDGNYTLLVDLNRDDDVPVLVVTYNCEYGEAPEVPLSELYICGNALNGREGGWNTSKDYVQEMTPTGNQGEFNWQGYLYGGCQFKFRYYGPDNGNWDGLKAEGSSDVDVSSDFFTTKSYKLTEQDDRKFVVDRDGYYSVTAKTYGSEKTMDFLYLGPETGVAEISEAAVVTVDGRTVSVTGSARIFDIAGRAIANVSNGSATLPAAGLYIVVADGKASRILVK